MCNDELLNNISTNDTTWCRCKYRKDKNIAYTILDSINYIYKGINFSRMNHNLTFIDSTQIKFIG